MMLSCHISMCKFSLFFLFLLVSYSCYGQSGDFFIVDELYYTGNDKTKERVIDNELDILPGDTIYTAQLQAILTENEKRLLSTGLFTMANIEVQNWRISEQKADLEIILQENWYIYPSFIFELADRNFNVWWKEMNADFGRVNYGLSLDHINLTGNRDKLKLKLQQGFTHKYELNYRFPYISKYWGMNGELFYSTNKEIGYITEENKTLFRKAEDERVLLRRFRTSMGVNYRPSVYVFHEARLEYHHNSIDELVATDYNPNYFLNQDTDLKFFLLRYNLRYDKRIFTLYPEGGFSLSGNIIKEGLGIFGDFNNLSVDVSYDHYLKLSDRWIVGGRIKAKTNIIRSQVAFANNTGLGYGNDLVRGYELYVIDGTDWLLAKTNIRWQLYEKLYNLGRYMPLRQMKKMPAKIYLRFNLETGYVNEPTYLATNSLNNRWIVGAGPALDIILWNVGLFSIEYSFNDLGESNLFLASSFNF